MGNAQRAQFGRGAGTLRPHPEYTATDARHGQLIATSRCHQTGTHPWVRQVSRLKSGPNYPCRIKRVQHQQEMPVTPSYCRRPLYMSVAEEPEEPGVRVYGQLTGNRPRRRPSWSRRVSGHGSAQQVVAGKFRLG